MMSDAVVVERLVMAMVLAGAIGYERERHGRAAGFRTHILVAVGSCLVMLTNLMLVDSSAHPASMDPTRMAAQVISGVGFLGAGTILRFQASIRGLTTAASLWAVAGIGIATGSGFLFGAVVATLLVLLVLFGLSGWERWMRKEIYRTLLIDVQGGVERFDRVRELCAAYGVELQDLEVKPTSESGVSQFKLQVKLVSERDEDALVRDLIRLDGTRKAQWV